MCFSNLYYYSLYLSLKKSNAIIMDKQISEKSQNYFLLS